MLELSGTLSVSLQSHYKVLQRRTRVISLCFPTSAQIPPLANSTHMHTGKAILKNVVLAQQVGTVQINTATYWLCRLYPAVYVSFLILPFHWYINVREMTIITTFSCGASGKEPACQCRKHKERWVPYLGWEDALEEGMVIHSSILCLENPMDRGAWQATVHRVTQSWT